MVQNQEQPVGKITFSILIALSPLFQQLIRYSKMI